MKRALLCWVLALFAIGVADGKTVVQVKEETIAGVPVKVISEYRSRFKTRFIKVVIAEEFYSRDNLVSIWRHYCDKYDKKERLDLRVYVNGTYEYNRRFDGWPVDMHTNEAISPDGTRVKLRSFEAYFERMGDGALAYGGDNELMIYSPNLDEPEKTERIVLAGKDPYKR
jgi:hypothetical protein